MAFFDYLKKSAKNILRTNPIVGPAYNILNPIKKPSISPKKPVTPFSGVESRTSTPQFGIELPKMQESSQMSLAPKNSVPQMSFVSLQSRPAPQTIPTPNVATSGSFNVSPAINRIRQEDFAASLASRREPSFASPTTAGELIAPASSGTPTLPPKPTTPTTTTPPPLPEINPETRAAYNLASDAYQKSLQLSPEELSTQKDLDQLIESTKKGFQQIEGQTIPLGFITGQLASLEKRALNLAEPLEQKLSRLQAKRVSAIESSKFALDKAEKQLAEEKQIRQKAIERQQNLSLGEIKEFGGNLVRVFPDGQVETLVEGPTEAAEQFTLSPGQIRFDEQGNFIAGAEERIDPKEQLQLQKLQLEIQKAQQDLASSGQSLSGVQLQDAVNKGYISSDQLKLYSQIVNSGGQAPELRQPTVEQSKARQFAVAAQEANNKLAEINYDPGLIEFQLLPNVFKGQVRQQFEQAARAFVNAVLRRESGATITDDEFKNKYAELIPQEGDSAAVKVQKQQARINAVQSIIAAGGSGFTTGNDILELNGIQYRDDGTGNFAPIQGFNQVGGDTNTAERIASAIKQVESGGNYGAQGASGEGGAYQFMPATWRGWARQYLGDSNAPQTPQNQDFVAKSKIQDLLNQGYNAQQIALIWNGGQPVVKKGVNSFGVPYDSGAYASKVLGVLQNLG